VCNTAAVIGYPHVNRYVLEAEAVLSWSTPPPSKNAFGCPCPWQFLCLYMAFHSARQSTTRHARCTYTHDGGDRVTGQLLASEACTTPAAGWRFYCDVRNARRDHSWYFTDCAMSCDTVYVHEDPSVCGISGYVRCTFFNAGPYCKAEKYEDWKMQQHTTLSPSTQRLGPAFWYLLVRTLRDEFLAHAREFGGVISVGGSWK